MVTTPRLEAFLNENKTLLDLVVKYGYDYKFHVNELIPNYEIDFAKLISLDKTSVEHIDLKKKLEAKTNAVNDYFAKLMYYAFLFDDTMPAIPDDFETSYSLTFSCGSKGEYLMEDRPSKYRIKLLSDALKDWYDERIDFPNYMIVDTDWYDAKENVLLTMN